MSDLDDQRRKRPGNRDRIDQIKDEMDQEVLRHRIEAVLWENFEATAPSLSMRDMADAVIAELNLAAACTAGCVWQIPDRHEDMTVEQKRLLERPDDE